MFCTTCGTRLPDEARFCVSCGTAVGSAPEPAASTPAEEPAPYAAPPPAPPTTQTFPQGVPYPSSPVVASKRRPPVLQALPQEIILSSPGRRLGAYLLDWLLAIVTLGIGWFIWSLIIWGRGQSPGKQLLKMRVVHDSDGSCATWGRMAFRELICKTIIGFLAFVLIGIGIVLYFWLLWDDENQELWDKMASTLVVDDHFGQLYPRHQMQAGPVTRMAA